MTAVCRKLQFSYVPTSVRHSWCRNWSQSPAKACLIGENVAYGLYGARIQQRGCVSQEAPTGNPEAVATVGVEDRAGPVGVDG
jgi:hypothetical protein